MGSDLVDELLDGDAVVSIHAPAWGATAQLEALAISLRFQFTLPHGERPDHEGLRLPAASFNSRSRMGSDR